MATVTLEHIARRAKVSVASVSKALAGDPQISESTRRRVERISRELKYQPRRRLSERVRRIQRVALLMCLDQKYIHAGDPAMQVVGRAAMDQQLSLELVCADPTHAAREAPETYFPGIRDVEGVLIYGFVDRAMLERIGQTGLPCVALGLVCGDPVDPLPYGVQVTSDAAAMGELAARTLLAAGHRRIGYCCSSAPEGLYFDQWLTGYRRAHHRAGVTIDPRLIHFTGDVPRLRVGAAAAEADLGMDDPPTAYVFPHVTSAAVYLETMSLAGQGNRPLEMVVGGFKDEPAHYRLEEAPQITEEFRDVCGTAFRVLTEQAAGRAYPQGTRLYVPFHVAHLSGVRAPHGGTS